MMKAGEGSERKQNCSKKHHFIPVFHLKQWTDPGTKKLIRHCRYGSGPPDIRKLFPSEVGFENHLNTLNPNLIDRQVDNPAVVEDQLARIVDDPAARVLIKMLEEGVDSLKNEERKTWAGYVLSLLERHPRRLVESEAFHEKVMLEVLDGACRHSPHMNRAEMEQFFSKPYCKNESRVSLLKWIDDPEWTAKLGEWKWTVLHLEPSCDIQFVLTDQPVVTIKQENEDIIFIALALSPFDLWIAHRESDELGADEMKHIVCSYNLMQCSKNPNFIISQNPLKFDGLHHWSMIFKKCLKDQVKRSCR
jgi:hypothetical protein